MKIFKKSVKSIIALGLCLCTTLSVCAFSVCAASPVNELKNFCYETPIKDCSVRVYSTEGGKVECTKATAGFLQCSGTRIYKATPDEGYVFDGWTYSLKKSGKELGNRKTSHSDNGNLTLTVDSPYSLKNGEKELGNRKISAVYAVYTFSEVNHDRREYNGTSFSIQLNRLITKGETFVNPLYYTITANFSKVEA